MNTSEKQEEKPLEEKTIEEKPIEEKSLVVETLIEEKFLVEEKPVVEESPMYVKKNYRWFDSSSDSEDEKILDKNDPFNFNERFINTHKRDFDTALEEIKNGRKRSCWSWYIYPVAPWIVDGVERVRKVLLMNRDHGPTDIIV